MSSPSSTPAETSPSPAVLNPYWQLVVDARKLSGDIHPARGLRTHIDWITTQPWLQDLAYDVRRIHTELRRAVGETTSRVATCKRAEGDRECGGPITATPYSDTAVCSRCGDEWPRARWQLLGRLQGA